MTATPDATGALTDDAALAALDVTGETLTDDEVEQLDYDGYVVLPGPIGAERLAVMRQRTTELQQAERPAAGHEVVRQ